MPHSAMSQEECAVCHDSLWNAQPHADEAAKDIEVLEGLEAVRGTTWDNFQTTIINHLYKTTITKQPLFNHN